MVTETTNNTEKEEKPLPSANQAAANKSSVPTTAPASCPLSKNKIQLFPLRYAMVENLKPDENTVQEQPFQSHPKGIRLIRDGYLYVFNTGENIFYEYTLKNGLVEKMVYKGQEVTADIRQVKVGDPCLVFDKTQALNLFVCYSEIQWTAEKCNQIILDANARSQFMQSIGVWNISCAHQGEHLITEEKAVKYLAEVAEQPIKNQVAPLFDEETTPYVWEDKTIATFKKTAIGHIKTQLVSECAEGNYLFLIVNDYIGMMKDLTTEQALVTKWLDQWSKLKDARGDNTLKYTIGNYIDSTLVINDANAENKQVSEIIRNLPDAERQAVYDYINASTNRAKYDGTQYILSTTSYSIFGPTYELTEKYDSLCKAMRSTEKKMIQVLGDRYATYKKEIQALIDSEREYAQGGFVSRGIRQLVYTGELEKYLTNERPRIKAWQDRLEKITEDRVHLYTNYFHSSTWYYDNKKDEQLENVLQCEFECSSDMLRNDESVDKLADFFEEHPYYRIPAFQTTLGLGDLYKRGRKIKRLLDSIQKYIKTLTDGKGSQFAELEKLMGRDYWKKILDLPAKPQHIQNLLSLNFSEAINKNLSKLLEDMESPKFSSTSQTNINSNLNKFERLVKNLKLTQRMEFLIAVRQEGFVVISDKPDAYLKVERYIANMADNIDAIKQNTTKINALSRNIKKINANKGQYKNLSPEEKKNYVAHMKEERDRLVAENKQRSTILEKQTKGLQGLISPLDAGENAFTLRMTNSKKQQELLAYEKEMIAKGLTKGYGAKGALMKGFKSASAPSFMFLVQAFFLKSAIDEYFEKLKIDPASASLSNLLFNMVATLSSGFAVVQAFHVGVLKHAIEHLKDHAKDAAGVRLAAKLSKVTVLFSIATQGFGLVSSLTILYRDHDKWVEALMSDETSVRASSLAVLAGNYGNAAVSTVGAYRTLTTTASIVRNLKTVEVASEVVWAVRGAKYATALARLTPWGLAFTALQIGGEMAYSYFNLSDSQKWFQRCCWGKDSKEWNQQKHNQELAETLLKPWLEDKGIEQDEEGNCYRVLQLSIPGQNHDTLNIRPLEIAAVWLAGNSTEDIAEELMQSIKVVSYGAPLILNLHLPWVKQNEWDALIKETREYYNASYSKKYSVDIDIGDLAALSLTGLGGTLVLRLSHTPDMASKALGGSDGYIAYRLFLNTWDVTRTKPAYIEPLTAGTSSNYNAIFENKDIASYRG